MEIKRKIKELIRSIFYLVQTADMKQKSHFLKVRFSYFPSSIIPSSFNKSFFPWDDPTIRLNSSISDGYSN